VVARKKRQKTEEHTTVKFTVNRIGMRSDLRERVKSNAARLQNISFVWTRFVQFVLLRDLKNGKDFFRHSAGKDDVTEQTFWDQCLKAVTENGEKNELDTSRLNSKNFSQTTGNQSKGISYRIIFGTCVTS